jgi:hypothetical protein
LIESTVACFSQNRILGLDFNLWKKFSVLCATKDNLTPPLSEDASIRGRIGVTVLGEDDRDIPLSTGLNDILNIFQDGLDNSMEEVLDIDDKEGSMP